jgi:hypothetical protein
VVCASSPMTLLWQEPPRERMATPTRTSISDRIIWSVWPTPHPHIDWKRTKHLYSCCVVTCSRRRSNCVGARMAATGHPNLRLSACHTRHPCRQHQITAEAGRLWLVAAGVNAGSCRSELKGRLSTPFTRSSFAPSSRSSRHRTPPGAFRSPPQTLPCFCTPPPGRTAQKSPHCRRQRIACRKAKRRLRKRHKGEGLRACSWPA